MAHMVHRPTKDNFSAIKNGRYAPGPNERMAYIGGATWGGWGFQDKLVDLLVPEIPPSNFLHIVNPRPAITIPEERRLTVPEQVAWERLHFLQTLSLQQRGVVMFWLGPHAEFPPSPLPEGRMYGQEAHLKFGEVVGLRRATGQPENVALGISPECQGLPTNEYAYMANTLSIPIHHTLEELATAALAMLYDGRGA